MNNCATNLWKQRLFGRIQSNQGSLILLFLLLAFAGAEAQEGYWVNHQGASWATAANWDSADGIAGGPDSTAYFGFGREAVVAPNASFSLDGSRKIGNLFFTTQGGPGNWMFNAGSGGSLTLEDTFGVPEISVTSPS